MTPEQFVSNWADTELKETASYMSPQLAHEKLDQAVLDAYGWLGDISDEDILARLLEENLKREPARVKESAEDVEEVEAEAMPKPKKRRKKK